MKLFLVIVALIATTAYGAVTPSGFATLSGDVHYYKQNTATFAVAGTNCFSRLRGAKKMFSADPGAYAAYVTGSLSDNGDSDLEGYGFHWKSSTAGTQELILPDGYWSYSVDCTASGGTNILTKFKIDTVAPISAVTAALDYDPSPSDRTAYSFAVSSSDYHGTTSMLAGVTALPNPAYDSTYKVTVAAEIAGITYQYKLDNGNFKAVTGAAFALTAQAAGAHCVEVRAIDILGNIEAFPAVYCWTVETYTKETGCTFSYSTNGASYATTTASSVSLSGLPDGINTFTILADDMYGNPTDSSMLNTFSWTIDTAKPVTTFTTSGTWGVTEAPTSTKGSFTYTSSEASSFFKYAIDGGASVLELTTAPQVFPTGTFAVSSCSGSGHSFSVNAIDAVGNIGGSATDSFTVEPINTFLSVTNAVSGSVVNLGTAIFQISALVDETAPTSYSYEYKVDDGAYIKGKHFPRFGVRGLADGHHTITARAMTTGGCTDPTPIKIPFTIDTTKPSTSLNCPVSPLNTMDLTVHGYVDDNSVSTAGTQYKLNDGTYTSPGVPVVCPSPGVPGCAANTFAIQLNHLQEGPYTLFAKSTDLAGLTGEETSCTWVVDMGPPETMVLQGPPTPQMMGENSSFKFGCMETSCVFYYSVDSEDSVDYVLSEHDTVHLGELAAGVHTIRVYAMDAAGNADPTPAAYTWTIYDKPMYGDYCETCAFSYKGRGAPSPRPSTPGLRAPRPSTPKAFEPISSKFLHGVSGPIPIVDPYADAEL